MAVTGYMLVYLKGMKRGRPVPGWPAFRDKSAAEEAAKKFLDVGVKEIKVSGK